MPFSVWLGLTAVKRAMRKPERLQVCAAASVKESAPTQKSACPPCGSGEPPYTGSARAWM